MLIPKNIILTYKKRELVPATVFEDLMNLNKNYNIKFFSDDDCVNFLDQEYGSKYAQWFVNQPLGMFKADLFRYCYLYKHGGYYVDVDIQPLQSFDTFVTPGTTLFSCVNSSFNIPSIFQALLFSRSGSPILELAISQLVKHDPRDMVNCVGKLASTCMYGDMHPVRQLYKCVCDFLEKRNIRQGIYNRKNETIQLAAETRDKKTFGEFFVVVGEDVVCLSRRKGYTRGEGFTSHHDT